MFDDDEIRAALRTLADRERFDPIESDPVIRRGRRGVRVRLVLATGVAAAAVAAVALTAASLPDVGASGRLAPAGTPAPHAAPEKGEKGLRLLSDTEAAERCRTQWSAFAGRDVGEVRMKGRSFVHELFGRPTLLTKTQAKPFVDKQRAAADPAQGGRPLDWFGFWPGTVEPVLDKDGKQFKCMIPGDKVPSAAEIADESIPDDDAGLLRRCSTVYWHDLTKWRVLARQVAPGVAASVAAMSPSGKLVVHCVLVHRSLRDKVFNAPNRMPAITGIQRPPGSITYYPSGFILDPGQWVCGEQQCPGWTFYGSGRMPLAVARLVATTPKGRTVEIPVSNGWFAAAFANGVRSERNTYPKGTLTAYDKSDRSLGTIQYFPFVR